ncbi:MAG: DUF4276 family protein [Nitrospirota bacterium]
MKKVFVYVEGPTEERFVKQLMVPYLEQRGIFLHPIGWNGQGKYSKVRKDLFRLLGDASAALVTTMLDYYGLPNSFPGRSEPEGSDCYQHVRFVENAIGADISNQKFRPHLTLHEFENLLFASPGDMAAGLPGGQGLEQMFRGIRSQYRTPEEINDSSSTAAHMRISGVYPQYQKALHGPQIAERIGLDKIRTECPHFNEWISFLESLSE